MKRKRKDFEIIFYERLIKENPSFTQALSCLGNAYTRQGFYLEGLQVDRHLLTLKPDDPIVHYNLACSLSLVGQTQEALSHLKKAVLFGYEDISYILRDPDLSNARADHRFKGFFKKIKKIIG